MSKKSVFKSSKFWFAVPFLLLIAGLFFAGLRHASANENKEAAAPEIVRYSENFDALPAPQLPAGWTTASSGAGTDFVTVTDFRESVPNAVFAPNTSSVGLSEITSPPIVVTGTRTILNFRHKYSVENTWDGGVLEIKIGDGDFQDILVAGGTFLAGGYTTTLNSSPNPLAGRSAWSGATQVDFLLTSVELPVSTFGRSVQFRWRLGSNASFASLGWWIDSITLESIATGANGAAIEIASAGTANPYPSSIQISGLAGSVTGVTVNLENFSHTSPGDIDVLLVAPNGRRIVLMSDAGSGAGAANNLSLTFTDAAAVFLPDDSQLTSGIFKPTNYDDTDTFPSPAPQGAMSGMTLGAFYGTNPNGTWSLYVVDDNGGNAGTIAGGWSLDIQSSTSACLFTISPTAQAFPAAGGTGSFEINPPAGCDWSVSTASPFITINSPTSGAGVGVVNFTVAANTGGARTGSITASDGFNSRTFQIQQGSGCPTSLAQTNVNFTAAGGSGNVAVSAVAGCTWQAVTDANWIQITSAQQSGNGTIAFHVLPNGTGSARSGSITVGARSLNITQSAATRAPFDFDGDGRTDIGVWRASSGSWWYLHSSDLSGHGHSFGLADDIITPGDYTGDGKTDVALFRPSTAFWYIQRSEDASYTAVPFGLAGDIPAPADYDGDEITDLAVFRPSNQTWFIQQSGGGFGILTFGLNGDRPVPADYDGDGKADIAVWRPSEGSWWYVRSSDFQQRGFGFGTGTDKPVPGDYTGDGKADIAVWRDATREWFFLRSEDNSYYSYPSGLPGDIPAPGDYDGDGRFDSAVFRPSTQTWYIDGSTAGSMITTFGLNGDRPVANAFVP